MEPARAIVERQPVGTIVVDRETIVRYANPAAAEMLGVPAERLVGEMFGLPLLPGGVTDVNVPGTARAVRTLAMRVSELSGRDEGHLVTLFDVSGRVRLYEHEHRLVESLQRSVLLDRMPVLPGLSLAARYIPGEGDVRVGGDWYDAIPLADGRLGLAIGDVAGHGVESAALMTQLRNALRAYALEHEDPAAVVDRLDQMLHHFEPAAMATLVYLVLDPARGMLRFCAAGHPYPLLVPEVGAGEFLTGGRSLPLGTGITEERRCATAPVVPGSMLVLYTDGLIERRTQSLDEGFASLAVTVRAELYDAERTCDAIVEQMLGGEAPSDDVAVLVLHLGRSARTI